MSRTLSRTLSRAAVAAVSLLLLLPALPAAAQTPVPPVPSASEPLDPAGPEVASAVADAASRLGVDPDAIRVLSASRRSLQIITLGCFPLPPGAGVPTVMGMFPVVRLASDVAGRTVVLEYRDGRLCPSEVDVRLERAVASAVATVARLRRVAPSDVVVGRAALVSFSDAALDCFAAPARRLRGVAVTAPHVLILHGGTVYDFRDGRRCTSPRSVPPLHPADASTAFPAGDAPSGLLPKAATAVARRARVGLDGVTLLASGRTTFEDAALGCFAAPRRAYRGVDLSSWYAVFLADGRVHEVRDGRLCRTPRGPDLAVSAPRPGDRVDAAAAVEVASALLSVDPSESRVLMARYTARPYGSAPCATVPRSGQFRQVVPMSLIAAPDRRPGAQTGPGAGVIVTVISGQVCSVEPDRTSPLPTPVPTPSPTPSPAPAPTPAPGVPGDLLPSDHPAVSAAVAATAERYGRSEAAVRVVEARLIAASDVPTCTATPRLSGPTVPLVVVVVDRIERNVVGLQRDTYLDGALCSSTFLVRSIRVPPIVPGGPALPSS